MRQTKSAFQPPVGFCAIICAGLMAILPHQLPRRQQTEIDLEVCKNIRDLGDKDFRVRETATKRLTEIGLRALTALEQAEENSDAEIRHRAAMITNEVRAKNHLPPRINGLEFRLVADKEWLAPRVGEETEFGIRLEITNITNTTCRIALYNTIQFVLIDSGGKELVCGQGQLHAMSTPKVSGPLAKNQTCAMVFEGRLRMSKGTVTFSCEDAFSCWCVRPGLAKGTYQLVVLYANHGQPASTSEPCWVGSARIVREVVVR
jgi:hypothetical protein